ncbi:MAG: T9SS type A sorting domain-containing protein [Bacteroidota bacterium]
MRSRSFFLLLAALSLLSEANAGDPKSRFDISDHSFAKTSGGVPFMGWKVKQPMSEIAVLPGFYLTWGTINGKSASALDNNTSILYGHPYAKTSYPVVAVDGNWKRADEMFPNDSMAVKLRNDSVMVIKNSGNALYSFEATYQLLQSGAGLRCSFRIINKDASAHSIGFGHMIDPAIGNRGDAVVTVSGQRISSESSLSPGTVTMSERNGATYGMRAMLDFPATMPSSIVIRNWSATLDAAPTTSAPGSIPHLYDAVIGPYWSPVSVAAHDTLSAVYELTLTSPNFGTLFTRWDIPRYLGMEDGIMHPYIFTSIASAINTTGASQNVSVKFIGNNYVESLTAQKDTSVSAQQTGYLLFPLTVNEIYENMVVDLSLITSVNSVAVDTLIIPMFIPKTPVSDTGLTVIIDSVITTAKPKISTIFEVARNSTNQKFYSLRSQNVFLYENGSRIPNFTLQKDTSGGVNALDLVFVLDVTGSMGGTIDGVKYNIIEFADSLKKRGVDYRLGMVTFLDIIENVYDFTNDVNVFKEMISQQNAHGGGDAPENSLDALYRSTQYPFRNEANRVVIWITDITYHENNAVTSRTKAQVVNALLNSDVTVHAIGPQAYQTEWYTPIIEPTGGKFYNIYGNFRDILLDISRMKSSSKFLLSYTSPNVNAGQRSVKIEVHVAGLGGSATTTYLTIPADAAQKALACYPNPFNPQTTIRVQVPENGKAKITIYDILGKQTRQFEVNGNNAPADIVWDATDNNGRSVSSGVYLIRSEIVSNSGSLMSTQMTKVIYLK